MDLGPFTDKWKSFGWDVHEVDMDKPEQLEEILVNKLDYKGDKPHVVICHNIKGKGIHFMEGDLSWHHKSRVGKKDLKKIYDAIDKEAK